MTTTILIILQEINFIRIKLNEKLTRSPLKSVSMKELKTMNSELMESRNSEKGIKFLDNAFESDSSHILSVNGEEDLYFDVRQYKGKRELVNHNSQMQALSIMQELEMDPTDEEIHRKTSDLELFIQNNQTNLIILFVFILSCQLIVSTIIMLRSVTYSHFKFLTLILHPLVIMFSMVFRNFSCNIF